MCGELIICVSRVMKLGSSKFLKYMLDCYPAFQAALFRFHGTRRVTAAFDSIGCRGCVLPRALWIARPEIVKVDAEIPHPAGVQFHR